MAYRKTRRIKRTAVIPITEKLIEQLKIALEWKTEDNYILPKVAERYLRNPHGVRKDAIKVFAFSGLETSEHKGDLQRQYNICRYGFHSFRHSFASIMASNGYNITMLSQILADDTKTLEKYYISIDDKVIKKTFNDIFIPQLTNNNLLLSIKPKENLVHEINKRLPLASDIKLKQVLDILK